LGVGFFAPTLMGGGIVNILNFLFEDIVGLLDFVPLDFDEVHFFIVG